MPALEERFREYVRKVTLRVPDEDIPMLMGATEYRELKKGAALLREGDVCRSVYLVASGYLRTYYNKDGTTINLNFSFEGDYTGNIKSMRNHLPSEYTIEAGEDVDVWIFNIDSISGQFDRDSQVFLFIRRIAMYLLAVTEDQSNFFKIYTPTERYHYIEEHNPQLLQRVSLSQISSYLGVTRETLSRIRAKRD